MKLRVGTSGFSYKEWKGAFYPKELKNEQMLSFYGQHLTTVEINNTFYRLPKASVLETWASQVPESFRFVLKASRKITHIKRLKDVTDETEYLVRTAKALGDRLGLIFFQLPPTVKKDAARLETFLKQIPLDTRIAFEFRHASWFDEDIFTLLRNNNCAMCFADTDDQVEAPLLRTAQHGYIRLRRDSYSPEELEQWLAKFHAQGWEEAYVFFKHEGFEGPQFAKQLLAINSATASEPV